MERSTAIIPPHGIIEIELVRSVEAAKDGGLGLLYRRTGQRSEQCAI